jgi:hypothetical protein
MVKLYVILAFALVKIIARAMDLKSDYREKGNKITY